MIKEESYKMERAATYPQWGEYRGKGERVIPNKYDGFGLSLIKNTKNRVGVLPHV